MRKALIAAIAALVFAPAAQASFPYGHNPVPGWAPSRVDEGVDGTLAGAYRAPLPMRIVFAQAHDAGWGNGGYVAGRIGLGGLKGQLIYVAEGIRPAVHVGQWAISGQTIAYRVTDPYNGIYGNIETGFANPNAPGQPLAQTFPGYSGDRSVQAITAGEATNKLIGLVGGARGYNHSGVTPRWSYLPAQIRNALGL